MKSALLSQAGYVMCLEYSMMKIVDAMLEGKTKEREIYTDESAMGAGEKPAASGLGLNADRTLDCLVTQLR